MADFKLNLTAAGVKLLTGALSGQRLEFTAIAMGSGDYSGSAMNITELVEERTRLPLSKIVLKQGQATLKAILCYADLSEGYRWKELGVYATDLDTEQSVLYAYANAGENYDTIPSAGETTLKEMVVNATIAVSDAATVTAVIDNTRLWVSEDEFSKVNDVIPLTHTVDSGIHIFTGLTREGLVPIQFAATADYTAGQTITIDSVRFTVALSSGDTPSGTVWKAGTKQLGLCDSTNQTLIIIQSPDNVPAHNVDPESHPDIRALLSNHEGRITRLENILLSDITGNPFLITFENLDGLVVTGTWNQAQARMEF